MSDEMNDGVRIKLDGGMVVLRGFVFNKFWCKVDRLWRNEELCMRVYETTNSKGSSFDVFVGDECVITVCFDEEGNKNEDKSSMRC